MSTNIFRQDDIGHMLKLEELFYNRFLNSELLNQLVSLYVKAIGFCNQKMSGMKVYFLEKMQFLLSRPQIQKLLQENEEQKSADKYTIKISSLQMQYETPQYVRKSSLRSQPVLRKLAQINDEQQKIQQRQNRINQQLQQMRKQIQNMGQKFSQKNRKIQQNELISQNYLKQNLDKCKKERKKSIRKNSLDLIVQKNSIIQSFSGEKIKRQEWLGWQRYINEKMRNLGIRQITKKKRVRFEQIQLMPTINNNQSQQKLSHTNLIPSHKRMKSFVFNDEENVEKQIIHQQQQQECHLIQTQQQLQIQKSEIIHRRSSGVFYSLSYGTFAGGHNTPQFSDTAMRNNTSPLIQFPKPLNDDYDDDGNLTDITQVSSSRENVNVMRVVVGEYGQEIREMAGGVQEQQQQQQSVNPNNSYDEKQYVDDEYF